MYNKGKSSTPPSDTQAREKLALYVYEYLHHMGAQNAAKSFLHEIRWDKHVSVGDPPGFLHSWWCVFWDLYCAAPERRDNCEHSPEAKAFYEYGCVNSASYPVNGIAHNPNAASPLGQMPPNDGLSGGPMPPGGFFPHQNSHMRPSPPQQPSQPAPHHLPSAFKFSRPVYFAKMATAKLLLTDLISVVDHVPSNYIRPISDRPNLADVQASSEGSIPLIDLQGLNGPNHSDIIQQIAQACQNDGFFQVKNHGVPEELIDGMLNIAREFFRLPESERMKMYSDDPSKTTRLSTSFNVKTEKTANWRDFLRLHCYPLEDYVHEWPSNPPSFREEVGEYCTSVRGLVLKLLEAISESLGLQKDYIVKALGKQAQHMALNYYPPCPEPELTYGLPGHTDGNLITILLQDDVPGLQVLRKGKWVAVNPIPNTFIVNIGDQMQVISNDRYKSVLHRAVVNCNKERISVPTFYCPSPDALIGPAKELVSHDQPAVYRNFTYAEFYSKFWDRGLAKECCLDLFKQN